MSQRPGLPEARSGNKRSSVWREGLGALRPLVELRLAVSVAVTVPASQTLQGGFAVKFVSLVILGVLSLLLMVSCGGLTSCETTEYGVRDLSEENPFLTGGSPIVDVLDIVEIERTEKRVNCHGRAKLRDGRSVDIVFGNHIDEDGTEWVTFRTVGIN